MILNYHKVEKLFVTCCHQQDVIAGLYKMVFPLWDNIKKIEGWPTINLQTNEKISRLFMEFDQKWHPKILNGGLWLNNGFSSLKGQGLKNWEVDISTCTVILNRGKNERERITA
jgi:hypothetical protein